MSCSIFLSIFGLLLKLDFCHANHLLHISLLKKPKLTKSIFYYTLKFLKILETLMEIYDSKIWNHEWLHHKLNFFHIFNISKWNSSLKYTFDKNFRCLGIFYNRYECFSPTIILKNHRNFKFSKKHLKESSMACRKNMGSLIENKKCNFYLIYIHVGEVNI